MRGKSYKGMLDEISGSFTQGLKAVKWEKSLFCDKIQPYLSGFLLKGNVTILDPRQVLVGNLWQNISDNIYT